MYTRCLGTVLYYQVSVYYIVLPGVCALYCTTRCLLCTTDVLFLFYLDIIHWSWYIHSRGFIYIHSLTIGSTHPLYTTPTLLATLFIDKHHYMYTLYILFADFPNFNLQFLKISLLFVLHLDRPLLTWGPLYKFLLKEFIEIGLVQYCNYVWRFVTYIIHTYISYG